MKHQGARPRRAGNRTIAFSTTLAFATLITLQPLTALGSDPNSTHSVPGAVEVQDLKAQKQDKAKASAHQDQSQNASDHAAPTHVSTNQSPAAHEPVVVNVNSSHAASSSHGAVSTGVPAETSLKWLQNGNTRYLKQHYRKDGKSPADRMRLSTGQQPHAIVLSCADSRVPPELIFDQALGEIFTIRVAGEALDSSVIASIEYAVEHLGSKLIVVMGHSHCGAVKAAITTKEGESAGSADLDRMIADIRPRLKVTAKEAPSKGVEVESAVNADGVARDLVKRSDIIRKRVEAGQLTIKSALYRIDSGKVSWY